MGNNFSGDSKIEKLKQKTIISFNNVWEEWSILWKKDLQTVFHYMFMLSRIPWYQGFQHRSRYGWKFLRTQDIGNEISFFFKGPKNKVLYTCERNEASGLDSHGSKDSKTVSVTVGQKSFAPEI